MKNTYQTSGYLGLSLAISLALVFLFYTFGLNFIIGDGVYWRAETLDVTQHLSGINMYLSSPWSLPLLAFNNLNYPNGTLVTFVDGIPILSLFLKIFLPKKIGFINPLGYWIGSCFILQSIAAWWITKELNIKSWTFLICLTIILLLYPPFIMRLNHASLMSHWIILFAISLYLHGIRKNSISIFSWVILLTLSFYINIYLFVMAAGIYLATIADIKPKLSIKNFILWMLPLFAIGVSSFLLMLPLPPVSLTKENGFGIFSMNILSPITGGGLIQLQGNFFAGQRAEGFNYLGIGIIISFLFSVSFWIKNHRKHINEHIGFFAILLLYSLYALSDHIYFGRQLIAIINYPHFLDPITSQLRCSGRFFWPAGYVIIIYTLYILHRQLNRRSFNFILIIILVAQLTDLNKYYIELKNTLYKTPISIINFNALDKAVGRKIEYIYYYPKYKCGLHKYQSDILLSIMLYSSYHHLNINTGYIARYTPKCDDVKIEISQSNFSRSMYIFSKSDYTDLAKTLRMFDRKKNIHCDELNVVYACYLLDTLQ